MIYLPNQKARALYSLLFCRTRTIIINARMITVTYKDVMRIVNSIKCPGANNELTFGYDAKFVRYSECTVDWYEWLNE